MIRVRKPPAPPTVLTTRGAKSAAEAAAEYDGDPPAYRSGAKTLRKPSRGVYAHPDVKAALEAAQHGKCAFCESEFAHVDFGDVEHYRPKGGFQQRPTDPIGYPGYYWLAYDWANLFASCTLCNQRFKGNLFPLRVQADRARSHADDLGRERPLLLHPSDDDPEQHITFTDELPVPKRRSRRGRVTIDVFGLDRPELCARRAKRRATLVMLRKWRDRLREDGRHTPTAATRADLEEVERALADAVLDAGEYAAMARVVLAGAATP